MFLITPGHAARCLWVPVQDGDRRSEAHLASSFDRAREALPAKIWIPCDQFLISLWRQCTREGVRLPGLVIGLLFEEVRGDGAGSTPMIVPTPDQMVAKSWSAATHRARPANAIKPRAMTVDCQLWFTQVPPVGRGGHGIRPKPPQDPSLMSKLRATDRWSAIPSQGFLTPVLCRPRAGTRCG